MREAQSSFFFTQITTYKETVSVKQDSAIHCICNIQRDVTMNINEERKENVLWKTKILLISHIPPPKKLHLTLTWKNNVVGSHMKKKSWKKKKSLSFTDENFIPWAKKNHPVSFMKRKLPEKKKSNIFLPWKKNILVGFTHTCCLLAYVSWQLVYMKVGCMLGSDKPE